MNDSRKRYAIVGTGGRSVSYVDALVQHSRDYTQLVGFCDPNQTRMNWHNARIQREFGHPAVPTYLSRDFDRMKIGRAHV